MKIIESWLVSYKGGLTQLILASKNDKANYYIQVMDKEPYSIGYIMVSNDQAKELIANTE